jgi:hypothetical protein
MSCRFSTMAYGISSVSKRQARVHQCQRYEPQLPNAASIYQSKQKVGRFVSTFLSEAIYLNRILSYDRRSNYDCRIQSHYFSHDETTASHNTSHNYLHVGPSGDCWIGPSIFAAKHLQPDYVKSIALPPDFVADHYEADKKTDIMFAKCLPNEKTTQLLAKLEGNLKLSQQIYDTGIIPNRILDDIRQEINV